MWLLYALDWSSYYIWCIFLEGTLVETLFVNLEGIYFIITWSFGMVKTLIHLYLLGFVSTSYFGV